MMTDIFKFIVDHLEGIATVLSLVYVARGYRQGNLDKEIEIYNNLFDKWDNLWVTITSAPEKNKELFQRDFSQVSKDNENLRLTIFQIITLLSRVHYYYKRTKQNIEESDWHSEVKYMMDKPLFISAYRKYSGKFKPEFKSYIESCIVEPAKIQNCVLPKVINLHRNNKNKGSKISHNE